MSFKLTLNTVLLGCALVATSSVFATDKELLDTLLQNGVLTKAQHEKLISQAEEKKPKRTTGKPSGNILDMDWASRIKISGDMRVRYADHHSDAKGVQESRQRIRARIALAAKINEDVDVGFRLVTTGGRRSSNQDLEGGFVGKSVFFDRAFIDWHPSFAPGMHVIAGKMKQPWYGIKQGLVWDNDVNPEGLAITYNKDFGQAKLKTTAGYFIVEDGKNLVKKGENDGFSEDQKMFHAGISGEMKITDKVTGSLGFNAFIYDDAVGNDKKNLNTDAEIYS
ncbi:MAG: putative porin, partial [Methylococcales bacterium]|nr:putative porin [Methylococcales bacterium]